MINDDNSSSSTHNPKLFPWHQKTWDQYIGARSKNHLPHAILLSGEEGIGKLFLARRMAKSLLCQNTVTAASDACGHCQSCKTYESVANPDFTEIGLLEDKKQIGVDQIRSLSEFLNYSRSYNTYRVVIINPVERMNVNAANSLLKSLEEPTSNTVIILVTAKVSSLLATIKSRCQLFNVLSPNKDESIEWLNQYQTVDNTKNIDANVLYEMVGSKLLHAKTITQEDIDSKQHFFSDLQTVVNEQLPITVMAKKWEKYNFETLIDWQIIYLQNAIKSNLSKQSPSNQSKSVNSSISLTSQLSSEAQWHLYQNLIQQKQYIHTSVNPLMLLENMIMLWTKTA